MLNCWFTSKIWGVLQSLTRKRNSKQVLDWTSQHKSLLLVPPPKLNFLGGNLFQKAAVIAKLLVQIEINTFLKLELKLNWNCFRRKFSFEVCAKFVRHDNKLDKYVMGCLNEKGRRSKLNSVVVYCEGCYNTEHREILLKLCLPSIMVRLSSDIWEKFKSDLKN